MSDDPFGPAGDEPSQVASRIAQGHAAKHLGEFPDIADLGQLAAYVDKIIQSIESIKRELRAGRTAFWDQRTGMVVILDPKSTNGGTVLKPSRGFDYFLDLD